MSIFVARKGLVLGHNIYLVRSPTVGFPAANTTSVLSAQFSPVYVSQATGTTAVIATTYHKA